MAALTVGYPGNVIDRRRRSQGRKFYSYLDGRLDVLAKASGRLISLGLS